MKNLFFVFISLIAISSCTPSPYQLALRELEKYDYDFSYVVIPEYNQDKATSDQNLKTLYEAERAELLAYGTHDYDPDTKAQINERYWLKVIIIYAKQLEGETDPKQYQLLAQQIAQNASKEIKNLAAYNKIEVIIHQHAQGGEIEKTYFFSLPAFEELIS